MGIERQREKGGMGREAEREVDRKRCLNYTLIISVPPLRGREC